MKKLFALLMSAVMLLVPVIGCAETADGYGYLRISNPVLSVTADGETTELDLTGLELAFAAENKDDVFSMLVGLLANGNEAITGHIALDETGLYATIEGMETGVTVSMETIEMLIESLVAELEALPAEVTFSSDIIGGADGPTSIIVDSELGELDEFFSEEAMAAFMTAATDFASSIVVTDPVEDTVFENDADVPAQRVDYSVETASLAAFAKSFGDLLMTNESFVEGYKEGFAEEGVEYQPLGDMMHEAVTAYNVSVTGSILMTEAGSLYADNYIGYTDDYGDECSANLYFSVTSDDEGDYVYAALYPTQESNDYVEFFLASMFSTEVEGASDLYCDVTFYEGEEAFGSVVFTSFPYYDEAGVINNAFDLTITGEDDTEISLGVNWYAEESIYGGALYVTATEFYGDEVVTSDITMSYDGQISADGLAHTGVFAADFYADENENGSVTVDVAFGTDTSGESIAYDFSGMKMLDLITASEEDFTALGDEAGTVLMTGLFSLLGEMPGLVSMLGL